MKSMEGKATFEVNWRPFFLNPKASREGINKLQYYHEKFGEQWVSQMVRACPNMRHTPLHYIRAGTFHDREVQVNRYRLQHGRHDR